MPPGVDVKKFQVLDPVYPGELKRRLFSGNSVSDQLFLNALITGRFRTFAGKQFFYMISRRNIRVKVMQTLYTACTLEQDLTPEQASRMLDQHFNQTRGLLVYLTWFLTEVARYAERDAHQRAMKRLITQEDLNVNTKIAGNETLWKILEDPAFREQLERLKPEQQYRNSPDRQSDMIRRTYQRLTETPEYHSYILQVERDRSAERKILEYILNDLILAQENAVAHLEELFPNWDDDGDLVIQLLAAYLQKPGSVAFETLLSEDKALFAHELLRTVLEKGDYLQSLIIPRLKNWDPERIAQLDMILMKMGVAEFLFFETIPPKVTINEYIDLAKEYSTPQSGQFVNGILDSIHKDLLERGELRKVDYKKG